MIKPKRQIHPNSMKNLEKGQWHKGKSGNPNGRPTKEKSITEALRQVMREKKVAGKDYPRALAEALLERAMTSSVDLNVVLDRTEGKVSQTVGFDGDMPMVVSISKIVAHIVEREGDDTTGSSPRQD